MRLTNKRKIESALRSFEGVYYSPLGRESQVGFAATVVQKRWFLDMFGNVNLWDLVYQFNNKERYTKPQILRMMAQELAKAHSPNSPEAALMLAWLVLNELGKMEFSRLMRYYTREKVNWKPIKNMDSIDGQIVAMRFRLK